ncbi:MAG: hypothetical protein CO094_07370 [Anaerolineae bacterium CG_4_9_14_3_um_filter_57_17]|nr:glycosyltransferase family 39 protein [bacterium]NCT21079.1 glycosyltransferase family 39 protein [bacterium]OIO87451.1 MAG: hypothetical protein AUK01_00060 [Anaerolineae bacterium CG2_30_57_67]PJB66399.1 MAG: hypothetical protein CO094_07370 [Anaerolineae bacterium CG_4_9_14_3_um_filter_57_17]
MAGTAHRVFLILMTIAFLAPVAPPNLPLPGRDEGVFLYVGQQINAGQIPYRDVWDHKGPLIYYINALGLALTGSVWGVWLLEVAFLLAGSWLAYATLKKLFGAPIAFASSVCWLAGLQITLDGGNTIEEFALLFEFLALYLFFRVAAETRHFWNEFFIGVCAALAFALRPNNIGIYLAIGSFFLLIIVFSKAERSHAARQLLGMALGCIGVLTALGLYFIWQNAFAQLYDALFVYNYYYSRQVLARKAALKIFNSLVYGLQRLQFLPILGAAGILNAGGYLALNRTFTNPRARLALLLALAVPMQLILAVMSGRQYLHYYAAWLSVLAFLIGFLLFGIQLLIERAFQPGKVVARVNIVLIYGFALWTGFSPAVRVAPTLQHLVVFLQTEKALTAPDVSATELAPYLEYVTREIDVSRPVLIWNNLAIVNFLSGRRAPGRFVYTYALNTPGYLTPALADEFLAALKSQKPVILDATSTDSSMSGIDSLAWKKQPLTQKIILYIEEHYQHVTDIGPARWPVWVFKGE